MKYGARNQLVARVTEIKQGQVMAQVQLELVEPGKMSSVMTRDSVADLNLKPGDTVKVVVKAVNVLVVKE